MTEKETFLQWYAAELNKGLKGIHITPNPNAPANSTEEEIYAELNRMREAPDACDCEVLGDSCPCRTEI